jgi:hypothetical protein
MDVEKTHDAADPFVGTSMSAGGDSLLSDMWDWCVLKGCRPICLSGRLFLRKGKWSKFRYVAVRSAPCQIPTVN